MPTSSPHAKQPNALALKQAANWQCMSCGKLCRRHNESLDEFAVRSGHETEVIAAHPRRWTLHVTKDYHPEPIVLDNGDAKKKSPRQSVRQSVVVLCGSCHRAYHNYRRWQRRHQQQQQQREHIGQLTLSDIRSPLTGLQLSLNDWGTPYEIVNPEAPRRRIKSPKTPSQINEA